jgi:predicted O-methyltransferase YrrM
VARMKNRIELAEYFNKLGFTNGAEVGVYKGEYAQILCEKIPGLHLIMVDSWIRQQRRIDAKAEAIDRTYNYNVDLIQATSLDAVSNFADGFFDFVFIDAGHTYAEVKEDIEAWAPKVRKGGVVSGHDYYEFPSGKGGVIPAVDEYVAKHGYRLNVIPWDKTQTTDNRQPCWWIEK